MGFGSEQGSPHFWTYEGSDIGLPGARTRMFGARWFFHSFDKVDWLLFGAMALVVFVFGKALEERDAKKLAAKRAADKRHEAEMLLESWRLSPPETLRKSPRSGVRPVVIPYPRDDRLPIEQVVAALDLAEEEARRISASVRRRRDESGPLAETDAYKAATAEQRAANELLRVAWAIYMRHPKKYVIQRSKPIEISVL